MPPLKLVKILFTFIFLALPLTGTNAKNLVIGSKNFTESYILAEILAQLAEEEGEVSVVRRFGMAGTGVTATALESGGIDIYPEYTGTISRVVLRDPSVKDIEQIRERLEKRDLSISESLGFNNTYALAVTQNYAQEHDLRKISDLNVIEGLRAGFSHEFIDRDDGMPGLEDAYGIDFKGVRGFEHSLLYEAISRDEIDLMEVYSTEGKLVEFDLVTLDDDKSFFPPYEAVLFFRQGLDEDFPRTFLAFSQLIGGMDEEQMQKLNAAVEDEGLSFSQVASRYLGSESSLHSERPFVLTPEFFSLTFEHLKLVFISVFFATLFGLPLGYFAYRFKRMGQVVTVVVGMLQTIPALALLCFLLPFFGVGQTPALVALFLYGLLPIVQNTLTGFRSIEPHLLEASETLYLTRWQKVFQIKLPLASINILTGIRTTGVINVGMATLAAFIGAGGYGTLIVTGLALNNIDMILKGAIPAAGLAIFIHYFFDLIEKFFIPKGLKN